MKWTLRSKCNGDKLDPDVYKSNIISDPTLQKTQIRIESQLLKQSDLYPFKMPETVLASG